MTRNRLIAVLALIGAVAAAAPARSDDAIAIYKSKCAMCHRIDNAPGPARLKLRDLNSDQVRRLSDAELSSIIVNGKRNMPPFGQSLPAGDVERLVSYIRSLHRH